MTSLHAVQTEPADYISATEVASLIRRDLKAAYPGVKFSVRSRYFSMGSSVDIGWTDGPVTSDVDATIADYCAQGFDGMTDSTTNSGPVRLADGRLVRISAWISTHRDVSASLRARVATWFHRRFDGGYVGNVEQEINSAAWRAYVVNDCLIVRKEEN